MRLAIAACLAVLLATMLVAQAPQKPAAPPQQPTFKTGISFVRLDVYPTVSGKIVADLGKDDFEVLEDGVAQRVETFEHVAIRAPGPEIERGEPNTVGGMNDAAGDPRSRVFVLFLDTYHIQALIGKTTREAAGNFDPRLDNAGRVATALSGFLRRLIGPDDLVALMTPEMPLDALAFTRRPSSIEAFLNSGLWQRAPTDYRDLDSRDRMYQACYGAGSSVAAEMSRRRHERMVLTALTGLVVHLQSLREERKAIVLVSEGWDVFRPRAIGRSLPPALPGIGVVGGKPTIGDPSDPVPREECDKDRLMLSEIDDERELRDLLQLANRANATFYPVDPRGLDAPAAKAEQDVIARRQEPLRLLAANTDGIPVIDTNDFAPGLKRIIDDLSSYYLLGYTSTNGRTDGRFRKITVRVKRPGVAVRARPGYLSPTDADVKAANEANALSRDPDDGGLQAALATLDFGRPNRILLLRGGYTWRAGEGGAAGAQALASLAVELDAAAARGPGWSQGGQLAASLIDADDHTLASSTATLSATSRSCLIRFAGSPLPPGTYFARVTARWSVMTTTEQVRIVVPEVSETTRMLGQPLVYRRSPYTGPGFQPTADPRFRKAERIRLDVPVTGPVDSTAGELLDRKGQRLQVPVTTSRREDGGAAVITADVALAPLAPGDYLIAVSARRGERTERALTAIRIVP